MDIILVSERCDDQYRTLSSHGEFYGGGMQNAYYYDHTGKLILIQEPGDYDGC